MKSDLKRAFTTLERYDNAVPPKEQIRLLREKVKTDNSSFNAAAITTLLSCNNNPTATFDEAVSQVTQLVDHFFQDTSQGGRKVRFKVGGVSAQDFADRHANNKSFYQNVDITDFSRTFSPED